MNLTERNHHKDQNAPAEELNSKREEKKEQGNSKGKLQYPYMTFVLPGIIVVFLICITVWLMSLPGRRSTTQADTNSDIQQSILDYAKEQKQNDYVSGLSEENDPVDLADRQDTNGREDTTVTETESGNSVAAADSDETADLIDEEMDESYSREFILDEAFPYFEDNNYDAIWDLAHLKRYVKLSSELEDTNQYYYKGDVNSAGRPDGKGLAIYEDNSYYYGDWSDGVRSGGGTWFRFYINEKSRRNAMGKYTSHSYSGEWVDDLPDGQGAEHFEVDISKLKSGERILQNVVGGFDGGLYDGKLYGYTVNYIGSVGEWDGVATKGVFSLWKDMSAIGECAVWRNKEDHTLYMNIDKSKNKNQGIQELFE